MKIKQQIPFSSLTVDVEDYFHAANLEPCFPPSRWHKLPSRVEDSTQRLLEIFRTTNSKGTFFILGYIARRFPALVKEIAAEGHEIASHGYGHRIVWTQTPKSFYRDIRKAKLLLEDLTGSEVLGYRAPNFSIIDSTAWAYTELSRAGYRYDSSLYPVAHPRYGNRHRSASQEQVSTEHGTLEILPLSTYSLEALNLRVGIAGGGWWRLLPKTFIRRALKITAERAELNCYLHPWEIDPGQPTCSRLSTLARIRHYTGLEHFDDVVRDYLNEFGSKPLKERL